MNAPSPSPGVGEGLRQPIVPPEQLLGDNEGRRAAHAVRDRSRGLLSQALPGLRLFDAHQKVGLIKAQTRKNTPKDGDVRNVAGFGKRRGKRCLKAATQPSWAPRSAKRVGGTCLRQGNTHTPFGRKPLQIAPPIATLIRRDAKG